MKKKIFIGLGIVAGLFIVLVVIIPALLGTAKRVERENLSKDVKDKVIEIATKNCGRPFTFNQRDLSECQNIKIVYVENLPIEEVDKANGITEKWCVAVDFLLKMHPQAEWMGQHPDVNVIRKKGKIEAYDAMGCRPGKR